MKRNLFVLLCLVAFFAIAFASCGINGDDNGGNTDNGGASTGDDCVHTFSDAWTHNTTEHWHAATCEHTEQKGDSAPHVDDDQNAMCDVCNYNVGHTHTYESDWTSDALAHWHAPTCKHTDIKGDYSVHTDVNANGKCDACDADVTIEIDESDYGLIIDAILSAKGGVASGEITTNSSFTSLGKDGIATSSAVFEYIFGNNCAHFKNDTVSYSKDNEGKETTATSTWEKWQEYLGGENIFGVFKEDDSDIALDATATLDSMKGYYFVVSTLANEYGVESILHTLYTLANDSSASEFVWNRDEDTGVYTFSFNYLQINRDVAEGEDPNVNYYELTVSFTRNDHYVLTSLDIICDCYTNSLEDERDHDYTYDDATGTITMKPEGEYAADTYTFHVTQVPGDRTYVNENPRNKFLPETFELFSDSNLNTLITDTITITTDKVSKIYLGNFLPVGTSITFAPDLFSATIEIDGTEYNSDNGVGLLNETLYFSHTTLGVAPELTLRIYKSGTYQLTVSIGTDHTKTITVIVTDSSSDGDDTTVESTSIEVNVQKVKGWDDVKDSADYIVSFTADKSGMYTVNIPQGLAAYDKQSYDNTYGDPNAIEPWIDLTEWNPKAGSFVVYLEEGQTYEFYVATYSTGTYTITYYQNEQ